MKEELIKIQELDKKIKERFEYIKGSCNPSSDNTNTVKALKNTIYEKASQVFIYNLKKLIQIETTQKNLAKKIGISEDLLSKYKSGEAFPSIETLIYICKVYSINISKFISEPLTTLDIEGIESRASNSGLQLSVFEETYYVYFLVTNIRKEGAIHEGIIEINENVALFKILSKGRVVKSFNGHFIISDKLISFELRSSEDGNVYINMFKPNVNKNKYVGGLAMLLLPSDANSKPCCQKIIFSKIRIDRELYYNNLKEILNFYTDENAVGNIKISQAEDELTYNFIEGLL